MKGGNKGHTMIGSGDPNGNKHGKSGSFAVGKRGMASQFLLHLMAE